MLCLPGFTPVAKLDQAMGDSEGWVEPRVRKIPVSASRLRFGQLALVHELPRQGRVHAVEAHHEDPLLGAAQRLAGGARQPSNERRRTRARRRRPEPGTRERRALRSHLHHSVRDCSRRVSHAGKSKRARIPRMWQRQTSGSVICPSCGSLVGVNDDACFICGRRRPGLFGFTALLRHVGHDMGFVPVVLWGCGALFLATLASNPDGHPHGRDLVACCPRASGASFCSGPAGRSRSSATGAGGPCSPRPGFTAGILHIVFNMMWVRNLAPADRPPLRRGAHGDHLHGRRHHGLPGQQHGGCLRSLHAARAAGSRGHGGRLRPALRPDRRAVVVRTPGWQLADQPAGEADGPRPAGLRLRHARHRQLGPSRRTWPGAGSPRGSSTRSRPSAADHVVIALVCLALSAASVVASLVVGLPG